MGVLATYGVKSIWCSPTQDKPYIFQLARLSGHNGVTSSWKIDFDSGTLPVLGKKFHLFQIGLISSNQLNLPELNSGEWRQLSELCMNTKLFMDVYTDSGIRFNLSNVWMQVTYDRNLIVAVEHDDKLGRPTAQSASVIDQAVDDIYLRFYSNAFFRSSRWADLQTQAGLTIAQPIVVVGYRQVTQAQILAMQDQIAQVYATQPGAVQSYCNGYCVSTINLLTCAPGDTVEFIYDASIRSIVEWDVQDLLTFDSELDQVGKYVLHTPGHTEATIRYHDDVDFCVIDRVTQRGVYLHKNARNACRMLTHCDYAIPTHIVNAISQVNSAVFALSNARIRMLVRHAGFERALVYESSRITELYKLNDTQIVQAMSGTHATAPCWKAENLEKAAYPALMGLRYMQITDAVVRDAVGYHGCAKLVGDPILPVFSLSGQKTVEVPAAYQIKSTVFEYDINGLLLGWQEHNGGIIYVAQNQLYCHHVEFVYGACSQYLDESFNTASVTVSADVDYRCYVRQKSTNPQDNVWQDITGDSNHYNVVGGAITWNGLTRQLFDTLVRTNGKALLIQAQSAATDGLMIVHLTAYRNVNGTSTLFDLDVPMGELDVWLNGHALIRHLGYRMDFPVLYIFDKQYMRPSGLQQITIRMKGLCNVDHSLVDEVEYGFVRSGVLSADQRYQVRDDKVCRVVANGGVFPASNFTFDEQQLALNANSSFNHQPYEVKDMLVPIKGYTGMDTYELHARAVEVDQQVGDYLSVHYQLTEPPADTTPPAYHVFSPFLCKIISDLKQNVLVSLVIRRSYTDAEMAALLAPYLYLYAIDPIHPSQRPDLSRVKILMHPFPTLVELDIYGVNFIKRVVQAYAVGVWTAADVNDYVFYQEVI